MFKQILKQLWFYRRGNAWLFVEMTLIAAASWFLVNAVWPGIYRTSLPDGYETDGVYAVSLNRLSEGQNGYRPEMDTPEQISVDFHRIGNALREMPEVQDAAPVGATLPGLNYSNYNRAIMVDTVNRYGYSYAYHIREAGASDLELLGYRQVWPQGAPIEDLPNTVIITEDLAQALFPGENPIGRRLSQFSTYQEYGWRISGVIAPVKVEKDKEYRGFVMYAGSDIVALDEGMSVVWIFRVAPGVDEDAFIQQAKKTWREDLAFGNWRVASVMPLEENLESAVTDTFMWRALFIFLLVCILIGVASFAWLRTRERRGETGVRRAMGGSVGSIMLTQLAEVWILFAASLIVGLLIVLNVLIFGKIDFCAPGLSSYYVLNVTKESLPVLFEPVLHFLAVAGIVAGLLLVVVTLSTIVPVAGALKESPADVLKDE